MSDLVITGGGGDDPDDPRPEGNDGRNPRGGARGRRRGKRHIPDVDACLDAIAQLSGLVALGLLKPTQANSIRASYTAILQHHHRSQARDGGQGVSDADLLTLMRSNPELVSMLEPLLTDEQIAMVMRDSEENGDG